MIPIWVLLVLVLGMNYTVWGVIGLLRFGDTAARRSSGQPPTRPVAVADVAVLMAAHNEEIVIEDAMSSIIKLVSAEQIFIVSDASTDRTAGLAKSFGVNVTETASNVGKAGALSHGIAHFGLSERFKAVLLLDADSRLDSRYFEVALPCFNDDAVVAVAGCAHTDWHTAGVSLVGRVLMAHRSRVYGLTQRLLKYGQTWHVTNRTHIVPGFASLYRTDILDKIAIDAPGLVIEDFNMTFEVYRKHLGRIAFVLDGIAVTQDPDTLRDYVRQMTRWSLGLWQTVRRHGLHLDLFSAMLGLLLAELISASVVLVMLPFIVLVLAVPDLVPQALAWSPLADVHGFVAAHLSLRIIVLGVLIPDYVLTCGIAVAERRPRYLLYGLAFVLVRFVDAVLALYTLTRLRQKSTGRWISPTRRDTGEGAGEELAIAPSTDRVLDEAGVDANAQCGMESSSHLLEEGTVETPTMA